MHHCTLLHTMARSAPRQKTTLRTIVHFSTLWHTTPRFWCAKYYHNKHYKTNSTNRAKNPNEGRGAEGHCDERRGAEGHCDERRGSGPLYSFPPTRVPRRCDPLEWGPRRWVRFLDYSNWRAPWRWPWRFWGPRRWASSPFRLNIQNLTQHPKCIQKPIRKMLTWSIRSLEHFGTKNTSNDPFKSNLPLKFILKPFWT